MLPLCTAAAIFVPDDVIAAQSEFGQTDQLATTDPDGWVQDAPPLLLSKVNSVE